MILVNYTRLNGILPAAKVDTFARQLPANKVDSIARLDCKQATATVLGLALLGRGVEQLGVAGFSYKQLIFSSTQKPSCSLGIEFNIAHSANIAACAVSLDSPLGIDTETTGIHSAKLLRHVFNESELAHIQNDNRHFLDLWVKKEAVAKASGDGVRAMKAIALDQERAHYNEQQWYLRRLLLDANEVSYLACQQAQPDIKLQEHAFADCLAFCTTAQFRDQHYG